MPACFWFYVQKQAGTFIYLRKAAVYSRWQAPHLRRLIILDLRLNVALNTNAFNQVLLRL